MQSLFLYIFRRLNFSVGGKDLRLPRISAPFRGTTRYASIAALKHAEQSRKDDVESWLYVVVEWTAGSLPWRKLRVCPSKFWYFYTNE